MIIVSFFFCFTSPLDARKNINIIFVLIGGGFVNLTFCYATVGCYISLNLYRLRVYATHITITYVELRQSPVKKDDCKNIYPFMAKNLLHEKFCNKSSRYIKEIDTLSMCSRICDIFISAFCSIYYVASAPVNFRVNRNINLNIICVINRFTITTIYFIYNH